MSPSIRDPAISTIQSWRGRIGEPAGGDIRDQVAERVAEEDLADEPVRVHSGLEVAEGDEPGADRSELGGIAAYEQVRRGRREDITAMERRRDRGRGSRDW